MLREYFATKTLQQPWGSLTGTRPTKLVRGWLAQGFPPDEILLVLTDTYDVTPEKAQLALRVAHAEARIAALIENTPALYVSIPFCPSRCAYCSFNIPGAFSPAFQEKYINTLIREIHEKNNTRFSAVYIGGGTPTALPENLLRDLLSAIPAAAEFTVEAGRPDTITPDKLKILRTHGVTRLAINPQTMNERTLLAIGRRHTAQDFIRAFHAARDAGFTNISCDIIAGLPGETEADMHHNFSVLSALMPESITVHTLAAKRASGMADTRNHNPAVASQLAIAAQQCESMKLYPYYLYRQKNSAGNLENTGFARTGYECMYNVGMMGDIQPIIGAGAGACTKIFTNRHITRVFNPKNPAIYLERRENP
jgi:oxygen-independent coproporphyrinogen-3 oxidase